MVTFLLVTGFLMKVYLATLESVKVCFVIILLLTVRLVAFYLFRVCWLTVISMTFKWLTVFCLWQVLRQPWITAQAVHLFTSIYHIWRDFEVWKIPTSESVSWPVLKSVPAIRQPPFPAQETAFYLVCFNSLSRAVKQTAFSLSNQVTISQYSSIILKSSHT